VTKKGKEEKKFPQGRIDQAKGRFSKSQQKLWRSPTNYYKPKVSARRSQSDWRNTEKSVERKLVSGSRNNITKKGSREERRDIDKSY